MATLFAEDFTGVNGAAWPAGWATSVTSGTGSATIQSNQGQMVNGSSGLSVVRAYRSSMSAATDTDFTASVLIPASGSGWHLVAVCSDNGLGYNNFFPTSGYAVQIRYTGSGQVELGIYRCPTGGSSNAYVSGFTAAAGARLNVRVQRAGATVRARVWATGATEPDTWGITWTDPSPLGSGRVLLSTASSNAARTVTWEDVVATDGVTGPVAPTVPNTIGTPTNERTTAGGRVVWKYQLRPDPTVTGADGIAYMYLGGDRAPGTAAKVCIAAHGYQNSPFDFLDLLGSGGAMTLTDKLIDAGYAIIVPQYNSTFGNADAQGRTLRADTYMRANWTVTGTVILGFSMGGGMALIAAHRRTLPDLRGVHAIASAIDLVRLGADSNPYPLSPDLRAAYGAANEAALQVASADYDPQQQPGRDYTGARIQLVTSDNDSYTLRPDALVFLPRIAPYAAQAVDINATPAEHGSFGHWANPDSTVAFFDSAIAAGPWEPLPTGRLVERWSGSVLTPVIEERWTGSTLVPVTIEA